MSLKIGIPAQDQPESKFGVNQNYLDLIYGYGMPVIITPCDKEDFFSAYGLDALLLPGGADVSSNRYSTSFPKIYTGNSNPYLEWFDSEILPNLIGKLPIFGICRGLQTLNVIFGGTLKNLWNHPWSYDETDKTHDVLLANNAKLGVNSFHHQAIDKLATNFSVEATYIEGKSKKTGHIEAISDTARKIFAVQWHPERIKDWYSLDMFGRILK